MSTHDLSDLPPPQGYPDPTGPRDRPSPGGPPPEAGDPPPEAGDPPPPPEAGGPPPPPDHADGPPPPWSPAGPPPSRRPWRDRLPELVAGVGTTLVVAAVAGFVTSTWEHLAMGHKAMVLAAVAVGLTIAAVFAEQAARRSLARVTSLVYLSASVSVAASATLFGYLADPAAGRAGILAGGLAAAVHAGWALARDHTSPIRALGLGTALLYAAGPAGTAASDRFSTMDPLALGPLLEGMLDPTVSSDVWLLPGAGWAVAGTVLVALSCRLAGAVRHATTTLATVALFGAALMLNIATNPLGALVALLVVTGYLLYGLVAGRSGIVIVGAIGTLLAGVRVLAGLFTGQVAVTVGALVAGVVMLAWAIRAARRRPDAGDDGDGGDAPDAGDGAHDHSPVAG